MRPRLIPPGTHALPSVPVPAGSRRAALGLVLSDRAAADPALAVRLVVEALFDGLHWEPVRPAEWVGGPGGTRPEVGWEFDRAHPPARVRLVVDVARPLAFDWKAEFS